MKKKGIRYIPAEYVEDMEARYTFAIDWLRGWLDTYPDDRDVKRAMKAMMRERGPLQDILDDGIEEATIIVNVPDDESPDIPEVPRPEHLIVEDETRPEEIEDDDDPDETEDDELWEMRGRPEEGDQGWVSNRGRTQVLPIGEKPGPTIYDTNGLGPRIRRLRESRGLKQAEVASKCGHTPGWLSAIENSAQGVQQDDRDALAAALGTERGPLFRE